MAKSNPSSKPASNKAPVGKKGGWSEEKARRYWKRNLSIIAVLLTIWALVSYVAAIFLANPLYGVKVGALPMSFWFAQQGAIVTFVILIFVYCWLMDRVDKEFDVNE